MRVSCNTIVVGIILLHLLNTSPTSTWTVKRKWIKEGQWSRSLIAVTIPVTLVKKTFIFNIKKFQHYGNVSSQLRSLYCITQYGCVAFWIYDGVLYSLKAVMRSCFFNDRLSFSD